MCLSLWREEAVFFTDAQEQHAYRHIKMYNECDARTSGKAGLCCRSVIAELLMHAVPKAIAEHRASCFGATKDQLVLSPAAASPEQQRLFRRCPGSQTEGEGLRRYCLQNPQDPPQRELGRGPQGALGAGPRARKAGASHRSVGASGRAFSL